MSTDIERYAQICGDLGNKDIQPLLAHAAKLSRERGRPEVILLDADSEKFREKQERIEEVRRRKAIKHQVIDFFLERAPVGARVSLESVNSEFHPLIGKMLPNDMQTSYLLLPIGARHNFGGDQEEALFSEEARSISPQIKIAYNRNIRAAIRVNLLQINDIQNTITLAPGILVARNRGNKTTTFLQQAFSLA